MQNKTITIAIDAMGGDFGPQSSVPGAALALEQNPGLAFVFYGDESKIRFFLDQHADLKAVSSIVHTDKYIDGADKPSSALRNGKGSSMRMAIEAVQEGKAGAVVSGGNTGALMALAMVVLRILPGIHRPALASVFPAIKGETIMLDLGANVLVDAQTLAHFAVMGAVFAKARNGLENPTVGLLNVGTEDTKGPDHVRGAAAILSRVDLPGNYIGFVEGTDITAGRDVDVIVCDGYVGNIALKAVEGVGKMSGRFFKDALSANLLSKMGGLLAYFSLKKFKKRVDPRLYNGGVFLGLGGVCVKSHGGSDAIGFSSAVLMAARLAREGYVQRVADEVQKLNAQETFLAQSVMEG
ncbi:MAG TPA: phosphate acyltransferase PlsX [Alphaproteobacteria bacterium]|nr:phosphate acyltransferase PlsX [Alphaproteobacteria bacterium]